MPNWLQIVIGALGSLFVAAAARRWHLDDEQKKEWERRISAVEQNQGVMQRWIEQIEKRRDEQHEANRETLRRIEAKLDNFSGRTASTRDDIRGGGPRE